MASKETSKEIIRMICEDFLGYPTGGAFPRGITRGLAGLKVYPREVVLKTLHEVYEPVMYQFNQGGKFKSDNGKVAYLFAVVCNNINPIYKRYKESQNLLERQQARDATAAEDLAFYEMDAPRSDKPGKDISAMLEDLGI